MINEMTWQQFSTLPGMNKLPSHEVERQYRIYLNEITEQRIAIAMLQERISQQEAMAVAASNGGGSFIQQEEAPSPSSFEFVVDTTNSNNADFEVTVSADTNIMVNWGDGQTEEMLVTTEDSFEFDHRYDVSGEGISYTVRVTIDNPENVTQLNFFS